MLKVAIVGAGYIAQNHINAYKNRNDVQIVAIICRSKDKGEQAAREIGGVCKHFTTLSEAISLDKSDVVDICTPTNTHEQFVIEAAKAGCHILCEKPVTFELDSFDRMHEACKSNGVYFMVAQVARWWPEYRTIKDYVKGGKLGNVHMIYEKRICQHPTWTTWHRDPAVSGGGLYDLNVHDIDYLYSLFGMPSKVYATGWKSPTGCWNHVASSIEWASGVKALCETSLEMTGNFPFSVEFRGCGDDGTICYALSAGMNINDGDHGANLNWYAADSEEVKGIEVNQTDMFEAQIDEYLDALNNKTQVPIPPEESRDVLRVVLAIKKSLENGTIETL